MRRRWFIACLCLVLAACGRPDMEGLEEGEEGEVAEIADGDTLILDSGLRVTLTGVEAPFGDQPFAREARAGLERMALHRRVRLGYGGVRRYAPRARAAETATDVAPAAATPATEQDQPAETALAQVFVRTEGGRWVWLQQALVREGLVRVRTRAENFARADELLAAEMQARAAERGLWALGDYRVLTAAQAEARAGDLPPRCGQGPFWIVEGRVSSVAAEDTRVYINFGEDYRTDFTIGIYGDAVAAWRARGPAFEGYANQNVRVRGRVGNRGGPLMCADHPEQIEILTPAEAG